MNASPAEMEALARHLWGEPNRQQSTRHELRFGAHGSKSVRLPEMVWHDHETGAGGGFIDLHNLVHGGRPHPDNIVAAYDYHDASGRLVFQVVRKSPKTFRQRRPDGNGGWIWDLKGVDRVPYRLHEMLKSAPHAPVFVVEGEKDCEALRDRGLIATTNPGGAGKWHAAMSAHLRGRHVVIVPDHDAPGEAHALDVAAKLRRIARSIRILRLPDLPDKGDVSDWLAAGGTAEQLEQMARETPELGGEPPAAEAGPDPTAAEGNAATGLRDFLAIEAWADRDMPQPDRLLGDLVTTTSRMFLVGRTGLGKTMLGLGLACGMASGRGFLHWRSARPARVLYIDGEMPGELIKARSIDVLRRSSPPPPGNLMIYARDMEDAFAARFPTLGKMPPLNTEAGQNFIHALIGALGGVDVVIFDNVMSLLAGDQKDEVPWSDTLPLVSALTAKRIGQIWLDHTGHNTDRQYGSSTKAWRFDAVGLMTPLPDDQRERHEVAFTLSFEPPGKARRRTPANWGDFETCTIRLRDDRWTSEHATGAWSDAKLTPQCRQFYRALMDAFAITPTPGRTTRADWYAECVRTGLADPIEPDEATWREKVAKQSKLRKYMTEIKTAGLIGVDGEMIYDLRKAP